MANKSQQCNRQRIKNRIKQVLKINTNEEEEDRALMGVCVHHLNCGLSSQSWKLTYLWVLLIWTEHETEQRCLRTGPPRGLRSPRKWQKQENGVKESQLSLKVFFYCSISSIGSPLAGSLRRHGSLKLFDSIYMAYSGKETFKFQPKQAI